MTNGVPGRPAMPAEYVLRPAGALTVLGWPALDQLGMEAVVTTRPGGVSVGPYDSLNLALHVGDDPAAVVENRRRAAGAIGATLGDSVFATQVHGRTATVVDQGARGRGATELEDALPGTDALVTDRPGPVLVTLVADCVPMVLFDPAARVLAAVHAGWRGTVARVTDAALEAMTSLGAQPGDVVVGMGPAVSPRTYRVGDEVAAAFGEGVGEGIATPASGAGGGWLVDLWQANRRLLVEAGVPAEAIHVADVPTGPDGPFFSDRHSRPCGRFALLARIRA